MTTTAQVTDIKNAVKRRENNYIHQIYFVSDDGSQFIAEELEALPVSRFTKGLRNTFEVTHPGHNGRPDWIRFISIEANGNGKQVPQKLPVSKDDMIISEVAFSAAVQLAVVKGWDEEKIIDRAYYFAANIKHIAGKISNRNFTKRKKI